MIAAICDDDAIFRRKMHERLVEYKKVRRIHLDIVEFSDGKELLNYEYPLDIVFLDYEMPNLNGMETARALRARKSLCCIIFLSSFKEYVFDAYEVNTYRYLLKDRDMDRLEGIIDGYIREKKMMNPVAVYFDGELVTLNSEDIIYLEADGKCCNIRTTTDYFHCSKTLAQVYELLPQHCFYRAHKSYAVNFYCISVIKGNTAVLTNKEKIKISRTKITDIKKAYMAFTSHFMCKGS